MKTPGFRPSLEKAVAMVSVFGKCELKWTVKVCWELVCISSAMENLGGHYI
jgi:hypothetical protein